MTDCRNLVRFGDGLVTTRGAVLLTCLRSSGYTLRGQEWHISKHLSTLTVLNTLDKGAGSLRDTITSAKSGDTIVFDPSLNGETITLTSDQLTINKSLDIEGPGASLTASAHQTA